jgi:preprotein translocase subunit SecA
VLSVLDRKWREHLYEMDYLREGVSLRGYGQRDPLIEYQREGYDMFTAMMDGIKEDSVGSLFNLQVQVQENPIMPQDGADGALPAGPVISVAQAAAPAAPPGAALPPAASPAAAPQAGSQRQAAQPAQPGRRAGRHAAQPASTGPEATASEPGLPAGLARGLARPQRQGSLSYSAPSDDASGRAEHSTGSAGGGNYANVGRNAPCPCGSGKKFKQCHGDPRNR